VFDGGPQRRACEAVGAEAGDPGEGQSRRPPRPLDEARPTANETVWSGLFAKLKEFPPGGDPVREAQADVPRDDPFGPRLHPTASIRQRQQALIKALRPSKTGKVRPWPQTKSNGEARW